MKPLLRSILNAGVMGCVFVGSLSIAVIQSSGAEAAPSDWSVTQSPNHGGGDNVLKGVSCASSTSCIAVGYRYNRSDVARTMVESWNGSSWSVVHSPNEGADSSFLYGVTCTDSNNCVAVGDYVTPGTSGVEMTLIESWTGTTWSIVPSPNPSSTSNSLSGVFCTSSTRCIAVGSDVTGSSETARSNTLVESLNGETWSVMSSQDTGKGDLLESVSCPSANSCTAVGLAFNGETGGSFTLVESWNGSAWSIIPSPSPGPPSLDSRLYGVSCSRPSSCVAVGYYDKGRFLVAGTLVESWDGSTWSVIQSPRPGYTSFLNGISCTSARDCVAVGDYAMNMTAAVQTLVESWNGSTWSVTPSPNQSQNANVLNNVSCTSSSSCDGVGYYVKGSGVERTLVESDS